MRTGKTLISILLWMLYWLAVTGATIYILPVYLNADQLNNSWISCLHFFVFTIISARFFKIQESLLHFEKIQRQIFAVFLMALLFVFITWAYDTLVPLSDDARELILKSKLYYPLFSVQTTIPKVFDIVFQQVTIFGFIKYLLSKDFEKKQVMMLMWLTFACLHTPLLLGPGVYAVTLVLPSLFAGLLFTYLILNFRFGLVLSFAVHFCFYFGTGIVLRTFYSS